MKLTIIAALRELRRLHGRAPGYSSLWQHCAMGTVPCTRDGRVWQIDPADLPQIAATLKLDRAA